ncbi:MAG: hypothetical protein IGQ45_06210 [Cyanobacterium sp. T60_A2020_053]|nr:hypothetical protein [Cyanobacterium sp. T60_A2020_053]
MLKSYQAIYESGKVTWLEDTPNITSARVIVTIIEDSSPSFHRHRQPPEFIAGKGKTLGNIVDPIVDEDDWQCLK